jgi:hypothetical protein
MHMMALTGDELLRRVNELNAEGANKTRLARETGYITQKKDGTERVNFTGFYEALLSAQGTISKRPKRKPGRPGRPLSYRTRVLSGVGHAVVGARYLDQIGVSEGDMLQISVSRGRLTLTPIRGESRGSD